MLNSARNRKADYDDDGKNNVDASRQTGDCIPVAGSGYVFWAWVSNRAKLKRRKKNAGLRLPEGAQWRNASKRRWQNSEPVQKAEVEIAYERLCRMLRRTQYDYHY